MSLVVRALLALAFAVLGFVVIPGGLHVSVKLLDAGLWAGLFLVLAEPWVGQDQVAEKVPAAQVADRTRRSGDPDDGWELTS